MVQVNEYIRVEEDRLNQSIGSDYFVIAAILPFICIARYVCERIGAAIFLSSKAAEKFHRKTHALNIAVKKFEESFWKCVYYTVMATYGLVMISWEPFITAPYEVYPNYTPSKVYWYYMIQMSFYIWMSVCLAWDVRKKDFYQMAGHHVTAMALLSVSYSWQLVNIGSLILLLMDIADPFLELAKIFIYLKKETASNITFAIFFLNFVGVRLVVYPLWAMYPSLYQTYPLAVYMEQEKVYYIANGLLIVLMGLNIFWSVLIVKVLIKTITGKDLKDSRSDDESS